MFLLMGYCSTLVCLGMFFAIEEFNLTRLVFEDTQRYEELAEKYVLAGAIPEQKRGDALHIAMATVGRMDILASWNCDHIVRFKTQQIVRTVNIIEGLTDLAINTPKEVLSL